MERSIGCDFYSRLEGEQMHTVRETLEMHRVGLEGDEPENRLIERFCGAEMFVMESFPQLTGTAGPTEAGSKEPT